MPVALALDMPTPLLIALYPAVNGIFFLPTYGTMLAAVSFDRTGTTRIGKFVVNHSFMLPGLVTTISAELLAFAFAYLFILRTTHTHRWNASRSPLLGAR